MNSAKISGYCDPKFSQVEEIFSHSIKSGHELGASLAVEIEGEKVIDLWVDFEMRNARRAGKGIQLLTYSRYQKQLHRFALGG